MRKRPNYDAVCFHAQQCIEKLLKGLLVHFGVKPPFTRNLNQLAELRTPKIPEFEFPTKDLRFLTRVGAGFRYPGETADKEDATRALDACSRLRRVLLAELGSFELQSSD